MGFIIHLGFPSGSAGKESTCNAGDLASIPGLGRSPWERNSYPLQYSGLENSTDCIVHGVAKSRARLSNYSFAHFILFLFRWELQFRKVKRHLKRKNSLHGDNFIARDFCYAFHICWLLEVKESCPSIFSIVSIFSIPSEKGKMLLLKLWPEKNKFLTKDRRHEQSRLWEVVNHFF